MVYRLSHDVRVVRSSGVNTEMRHLILLLTLILFPSISASTNQLRPLSELRSPTWQVQTSCLTEVRAGKKSCWGIVIDFEDARFKAKISAKELKIYEAKHGASLLKLMTWRVSKDGKQLVIKFKPGTGDFGSGNEAQITLYRSVFMVPPKHFPDYVIFSQNTDLN
jgi:hypothetical protein